MSDALLEVKLSILLGLVLALRDPQVLNLRIRSLTYLPTIMHGLRLGAFHLR